MAHKRTYRHVMRCPVTGKLGYKDRGTGRTARRLSRLMNGEKTSEWSVYRCRYCDYWHIGHNYTYKEHQQKEDES